MTSPFVFKAQGINKMYFDWQATQRKAGARIIPIVLADLRRNAPISNSKPDAGRFQKSIGYRIESGFGVFRIKFVSTAPYAKWVLEPTAAAVGPSIFPVNTLALRFKNGFGDYVFASSVVRGATKGNDFNIKVAERMSPYIKAAFADSITIITTED